MNRITALLFCAMVWVQTGAQSFVIKDRCGTAMGEGGVVLRRWSLSPSNTFIADRSKLLRIPVVVHILHSGEPVGEGFNFPSERIVSQIETLNEDFRRENGTPGFNSHPDSEDTRIEFVLAQIDPEGHPTDGIVRVNRNDVPMPPGTTDLLALSAAYSYWDPDRYLNIWCWDIGLHGIYAGKSHFPVTDLEGLSGQGDDAIPDGIFINAVNFGRGETNTLPNFEMGRTLTHEMGHFLGLLHTFGPPGSCDYTDYCEDTPPINTPTVGCPTTKPIACDGRIAMIENYMDYSYDACMNIFTKDQNTRMRFVLENSPRRKSLTTSPVIDRSSEIIAGIPERKEDAITTFPNPVTDKIIYVDISEELQGSRFTFSATTISGQIILKESFIVWTKKTVIQIPISDDGIIILSIDGAGKSYRQKIRIN